MTKGEWLWVAVFIIVVMTVVNNVSPLRSIANPSQPMF